MRSERRWCWRRNFFQALDKNRLIVGNRLLDCQRETGDRDISLADHRAGGMEVEFAAAPDLIGITRIGRKDRMRTVQHRNIAIDQLIPVSVANALVQNAIEDQAARGREIEATLVFSTACAAAAH